MKKRIGFSFEQLEDRCMPAVTLTGGLLTASVDTPGGVHTVQAQNGPNPGDVTLKIDGFAVTYTGVTSLDLRGAKGAINIVENDTALAATLTGVGYRDTLFGGFGVDTLNAGKGSEVLYDLFGANTFNAANHKGDRIFTNAVSTINADILHGNNPLTVLCPGFLPPQDKIVTFFAAGRTPGSGTIVLDHGVLYLTPPGAATNPTVNTTISESRYTITVTTDWGGTQTFNKSLIHTIAYFGGSGVNHYTNNTTISDVAYGGPGNDVLVGGRSAVSLLKGLGGSDVAVARAYYSDVSNGVNSVSDGQPDTLIALGRISVTRGGAEDTTIATNLSIMLAG